VLYERQWMFMPFVSCLFFRGTQEGFAVLCHCHKENEPKELSASDLMSTLKK